MTQEEILRQVHGAFRLARLDPRGLEQLDLSVEGFWRSFTGPVLALPVYLLVVAAPIGGGGPLLPAALGYLAAVVVSPLMALVLARLFDLGHRYVALIVALNWSVVVQALWFAACTVVALVLPDSQTTPLLLAATVTAILYQGYVTWAALETTPWTAAGFVVVDVLATELVHALIDQLVG